MNARIRVLVAAGCIAAYSAVPTLMRPLYPLLSNAGMCAQRVESLADAIVRVESFTQLSRRTP